MSAEKRLYDTLLAEHLDEHRQMAFVAGPRQVGKTTTSRRHATLYSNWDNSDDRELILAGPKPLADSLRLDRLSGPAPVVLFDELHKYPKWKQFLKGFFDTYSDRVRVIVTGISSLDVYRRGGDSLMGRYFLYHMHPFSIGEILHTDLSPSLVRTPKPIDSADFEALWQHGGYPEVYLKRDVRFSRRWQSLRIDQLVQEEIRDLNQVQHLAQLEALVRRLLDRSSQQLIYAHLATEVRVSVDTIRRWIELLQNLHLGFLVRPWFKNVSRSLRKEPKWFLRDWASITDPGHRAETLVACHLLKAAQGWTDLGLGRFELGYLRDKQKREVDFVVVRNGKPWFLVEVKHTDDSLSPALEYFQDQLGTEFAFQVILDADYVDADCFATAGRPLTVPARTLLSQLL